MTIIQGKPTTELVNLNVKETLFINEVPVAPNIEFVEVLDAFSLSLSQEPSALDTPINVNFGVAQGTINDPVMIDATGLTTFNEAGTYILDGRIQFGRTGASGVSIVVGSIEIDGSIPPNARSVTAKMANADVTTPITLSRILQAVPGTTMRFRIYRDSAGTNFGGLFGFDPTLPGWNLSPSASLIVSQIKRI
jgi:hypothetical protein